MPDDAPVTRIVLFSSENGLKTLSMLLSFVSLLFKIKLLGRHTDVGVSIFGLGHEHTASAKGNVAANLNTLQHHAVDAQQVAIACRHLAREPHARHEHIVVAHLHVVSHSIGAVEDIVVADLDIARHAAIVLDDIALADLEGAGI